MKTEIYKVSTGNLMVQCFKYDNVDELKEDAYEIRSTNKVNEMTDFVTTNTPQGAIALADMVIKGYNAGN